MVLNKITTIKLTLDVKKQLDQFKEYRNESYDEIVAKIIKMSAKDRIRIKDIRKRRMENGLHKATSTRMKKKRGKKRTSMINILKRKK